MVCNYGYSGFIGMGEEDPWAEEAVRSKWFYVLKGGDEFMVSETPVFSNIVTTMGEDAVEDFGQGLIKVVGGLDFEVPVEGAELLFKHAFGSVNSDSLFITSLPTITRHTFSMVDVLQPYKGLTVEAYRGSNPFIYTGGKVEAIEFSSVLNQYLRAKAAFKFKQATAASGSPSVPAVVNRTPFCFTQGLLTWGGTAISVESIRIRLQNTFADRQFVGSRFVEEPVRIGKVIVTAVMRVEFDSMTMYDDFRSAEVKALEVDFTGEPIGGTEIPYSMSLSIPKMRVTHAAPQIVDEGRIVYEVTGRAFRNATYKELEMTLVNGITVV